MTFIIELRRKKDYGKLSNRNPDDLRSGTSDLVIGDKEDALDFAFGKKMTLKVQVGLLLGEWVDLVGTLNVVL